MIKFAFKRNELVSYLISEAKSILYLHNYRFICHM